MCNESYIYMSATQYAALYNAAHQVTSRYPGEMLLAVGTSDWFEQQRTGCSDSCGWFSGLAAALPGGANEVDAVTLHPYPYDPAPDGSNINAGGDPSDGEWWGMLAPEHAEAQAAGFTNQKWWITEAAVCTSAGSSCDPVNSDAVKGEYLQKMLTDVAQDDPWVAAFFWYSSFDDTTGGWGILNMPSGSPFQVQERGSFLSLKSWMASNASTTNG